MKRRTLLASIGGTAAAWSVGARAQRPGAEAPKLGFVYPGPKDAVGSRVDSVVLGLRGSGYPVQQLELVVRAAEGDASRIEALVAEVIGKQVAAILAVGRPVVEAARAATKDIPIIAVDLDPILSPAATPTVSPGPGTI
jgi:putative tryptophan/tyrosine transport system substrate-binding protein